MDVNDNGINPHNVPYDDSSQVLSNLSSNFKTINQWCFSTGTPNFGEVLAHWIVGTLSFGSATTLTNNLNEENRASW